MRKYILKYGLLIAGMVILSSCEKEYPWKFQSEELNRLVVDGIITNELKEHCIKLSTSNGDLNESYKPFSGASVTVSTGDSSYIFEEIPVNSGNYYSHTFRAVVGKAYILTITAGSTVYEATASMVPVTVLSFPLYTKHSEQQLYRYAAPDDGNPSMTEVNYDWSSIPSYCEVYGHCLAMEIFYILNNVDVNQVFGPDKEVIWFPAGTTLIRKKYSITEDHQKFFRSLLMETEWSGGLFDVQHGNVPSNISNGALGFFAACMVVSDTVVVVGF